jgi:hypothetical protein
VAGALIGAPAWALADGREDAARATVATFAAICVGHEGDVRGARAALAARHLPALAAAEARKLMVHPGRIYVADVGADERFLVLSFDNGMCGTVAPDIAPGTLLATLADTMKARGITVEAVGEAPTGVGQAYRLLGPGTRLELMVDIARRADGGARASMLATSLDRDGH